MKNDYKKELTVAKRLALQAGPIMLKYFFAADQGRKIKSDGSEVTTADIKINELVIRELSKNFNDGIIGEEKSTAEYGMGRLWFCDPIDGTMGFVWGTPTAMFSLGLVVDGRPVMGVTFDPFLKKMYWAVKGQGSFCNGKRLKVSTASDIKDSYVAINPAISIYGFIRNTKFLDSLEKAKGRLAIFSGAVYKASLIARGRLVGYIDNHMGNHDLAASHVIVEEAGGKITSLDGKPLDYSKPLVGGAIISNGKLHKKLLDLVK